MKWIGLTGGIATGKTTVAQIFQSLGCPVVDADQLARDVVKKNSPGFYQVVQAFGPAVLDFDGSINRRELGKKVFQDSVQLEKLERIIHPLVAQSVRLIREGLEKQGRSFAIYDVPLVFEKKMQSQFDGIIVVSTSLENQKSRMRERDGLTENEIEDRLRNQIPMSEKIKNADYVIENSDSVENLGKKVKEVFSHLCRI